MILTGTGMIRTVSAPISPVVQCFTANGTWNCCTGAVCIEVVAVAGGGGGGAGARGTNSTATTCMRSGGPGGGAGGVVICTLTSAFGSTQPIIIGPGGTGGIGASNVLGVPGCASYSGGASCFGTLVVATGGGGGGEGAQGNYPPGRCTAGGVGGNSSPDGAYACVNNLYGQNGNAGSAAGKPGGGGAAYGNGYQNASPLTTGGAGSTICGITLGTGGDGGDYISNGNNATGYGAGGGGGAAPRDFFCVGYNGGKGSPGIIKVIQYFS